MNSGHCKRLFYQLVYPSHPNEWEVDEIMEHLGRLPEAQQELLFAQVSAIWPVSHSLCFSFLEQGSEVLDTVPPHLVADWVRTILARYETGGLVEAREYIVKAEEKFLKPFRDSSRVVFEDIADRLTFFVRGLSGKSLDLSAAAVASTDTKSLFLPAALNIFPRYDQNLLFYKFLALLHWGFIRQGTFKYRPTPEDMELLERTYAATGEHGDQPLLTDCFELLPEPLLARDCFFLLETLRVKAWMEEELPGLADRLKRLSVVTGNFRLSGHKGGIEEAMERFTASCIFDVPVENGVVALVPADFCKEAHEPALRMDRVIRLFEQLREFPGSYQRPALLDLLGIHDFERSWATINRSRQVAKDTFVAELLKLIESSSDVIEADRGVSEDMSADSSLVVLTPAAKEGDDRQRTISIDNQSFELSDELLALINEIEDDFGSVPPSYFSAAAGKAGKGMSRETSGTDGGAGDPSPDALLFDEWDCRRNGYRKNWCHIHEKPLPELKSTFVATTLQKHRGLLLRLRRQFEMMRISEHFARRQREGNDLDLDAIIEARSDHRAGISPTDRLFIRLQRNERDIASLFLVDMSNSTEGWIGTVIKESLVLLCSAMEVVGDRYGIYGFSGMRRTRCEIFPIKHLGEPYNRVIHERIGAMMPREYTRMGPAIRYASEVLKNCDARTRLLVTITDGKPEDYDDYKGTYAIEDTRKALLEARGGGLHAFCITVDTQAHEYLPYMCGSGNFVCVDDINKLPFRMVEMYRHLTV